MPDINTPPLTPTSPPKQSPAEIEENQITVDEIIEAPLNQEPVAPLSTHADTEENAHGVKRKEMEPIQDEDEDEEHDTGNFVSRKRNTLEQGIKIMNYNNKLPTFAFFSISNDSSEPDYADNLSLDFYKPFLQELFKVLTEKFAENSFLLTGSAAKQLQNNAERNPNDIDILLLKDDLVEGSAKLRAVINQIHGVSSVSNELRGALGITYNGTLFKVQAIDSHTSSHCFPPKQDRDKLKIDGNIVMLDALVIPQKDEDDDIDFGNDDIVFETLSTSGRF